jgi:hypothetical protein
MDVCHLCLYVVLSCVGRGPCDVLITRPEESYLWPQKPRKGPYVPSWKRQEKEWMVKGSGKDSMINLWIYECLYVFSLFHDTVSSSDNIAYNDRMLKPLSYERPICWAFKFQCLSYEVSIPWASRTPVLLCIIQRNSLHNTCNFLVHSCLLLKELVHIKTIGI